MPLQVLWLDDLSTTGTKRFFGVAVGISGQGRMVAPGGRGADLNGGHITPALNAAVPAKMVKIR
jgi:hypothetical protein